MKEAAWFLAGLGVGFLTLTAYAFYAEARSIHREMRRYSAMSAVLAKTSKPVNKP